MFVPKIKNDIEKNISFHPFSRKLSVGECR